MSSRGLALALFALYALIFLAPGFFTMPPLDRDEARFAQATKQMLETGDPVEIRFQNEARNKKPVGIYWMQAASASAFGGAEAAPIWAYRIPSALGAILTIWFTWLAGAALVGRRAAAIGAVVLAISMLMVAEGHIAKTDAMQAACITAMMAGLARAFMRFREDPALPPRWSDVLLVWVGLGLAALIKGPVGLMVGGGAIGLLWLLGGGFKWLRNTRPGIGFVIALAVFSPWAIAITIQTGGQFWYDAIWGDMLSKVVGAQEKHSGFPGYYLLLVTLTLFPGSLLLLPSAWRTVQMRAQPWAMFLIAWVVPAWIIFELLPTKLPHYTLPCYPALAIAIGAFLNARLANEPDTTPRWAGYANLALWGIFALALAAIYTAAPNYYSGADGAGAFDILLTLIVMAAAAALAAITLSQTWRLFLPAAAVLAAIAYAGLFERTFTATQDLHVSPRIAELVRTRGDWTPGTPIVSTGYHEPSLVFLTETDIDLAKDGETAADFLAAHRDGVALVEERQMEGFLRRAAEKGLRPERKWTLNGFNYSRGQPVKISIYQVRD
ncbi:MAG: glycosyltransferase family 39 protein [Micropepsaceae bacterium]